MKSHPAHRLKLRTALLSAVVVFFLASSAYAESVGVILTSGAPFYKAVHNEMMSLLSRNGYDKKIQFIVQEPHPDPISWSNAARKLIAADVSVMLTYGTAATVAAIRERPDIPILYVGVYEPVASGFKAKNATGVTSKTPLSSLLRYLRGCGNISELAVIYSSLEDDSALQLKELINISDNYNMKVTGLNLKRPADITGLVPNIKIDAIFITSSSSASAAYQTILNIAKSRKIPTASLLSGGDLYAIITLSPDPKEMAKMAEERLVRLLAGESPKTIHPASPKSMLIFNLREAVNQGIKIPMNLVTEATEIIE
jgi:putative ABC transport system substrate-binding protein